MCCQHQPQRFVPSFVFHRKLTMEALFFALLAKPSRCPLFIVLYTGYLQTKRSRTRSLMMEWSHCVTALFWIMHLAESLICGRGRPFAQTDLSDVPGSDCVRHSWNMVLQSCSSTSSVWNPILQSLIARVTGEFHSLTTSIL
jgi:hypothetical protein